MTSAETRYCDYCQRYSPRYVVRSDDEVTEVCARHLTGVVDRLSEGQDTYLTVAPFGGTDDQH
jgi:hypothetical protein